MNSTHYNYNIMNMRKILIIIAMLAVTTGIGAKKKTQQQSDREYWCALAYRMAQPVLENMARGELQKNMQTEFSPSFDKRDRSVVYMETFGRLMAGIAPWIALPDDETAEGKQRRQLRVHRVDLRACFVQCVHGESTSFVL